MNSSGLVPIHIWIADGFFFIFSDFLIPRPFHKRMDWGKNRFLAAREEGPRTKAELSIHSIQKTV